MAQAYWGHNEIATAQEIQKIKDPEIMMADIEVGGVAILEVVSDNDALDGSYTVTWLRPRDLADARRYVQQAGEEASIPGPGEYDGVYTLRTIWVKELPDMIIKASAYGS